MSLTQIHSKNDKRVYFFIGDSCTALLDIATEAAPYEIRIELERELDIFLTEKCVTLPAIRNVTDLPMT